jgi:hypothetical protein
MTCRIGMEYVASRLNGPLTLIWEIKSMSEINSHMPRSLRRNWTGHVPESLARALERRHLLDSQQRAFQREPHTPPLIMNKHPRGHRPA